VGSFDHRIRVRYAETDAQGVAHHAAYVPWLEEARIEGLRRLGRSYREMEADGLLLPVVELRVRYRRSLRFDDEVLISTDCRVDGRMRLRFASTLRRGEELIAEAEVVVAAVDGDGRPRRLPQDLVASIDAAGA